MRKNSPRKWLHATLDLLPVILIPVFMIYSHRHDVTENVQVTYKYESNEVNSLDDLVIGNIYEFNTNGFALDEMLINDNYITFQLLSNLEVQYDYLILDDVLENVYKFTPNTILGFFANESSYYIGTSYDFLDYQDSDYDIIYQYDYTFTSNCTILLLDYDENFAGWDYLELTDYNVIESVDVENTDVMDSFMNHFNTTVNKHFNMGNVFNLGGVYQWFDTNIFGGHAPTVIYSVWNIALYELVMDLLFLLYGLFMWFIDMIQKLMEKPLDSVK